MITSINDDTLEKITDYVISFYPAGTPVDWHDALYRVEGAFDIELPDSMISPIIVKIQRAVRNARRASE